MPILGSPEDEERKLLMFGEDDMPTTAEDLKHYLEGEFQKGTPYQLTARDSDKVGRKLSDREVSRLEVISAMEKLRYRRRRIIRLLYVENLAPKQAAKAMNISLRTLYDERREALSEMANTIYEWASA
jgi:DNA-directed RNA polymerase specialized sigma24 family protein